MFINRLFQKAYPFLDWIQVEITSHCNGKCTFCPHTEYKEHWQSRHLPMELFWNLMPAFAKTKLLYLQGWGEPFTHPHFFDMLRLARRAGCMVGTTTNGTLLSSENIKGLIYEGLDIIAFSLAGVDEKNDSIRKGTRIKKVLTCIEEIHRAKNAYGVDNPKIHIAYMLLRSGLDDLEELPAFLGNAGISQTVVSSLSLVVNPALEAESVLASGEKEYSALKSRLFQVREASANRGTKVHFHIVSPLMKESYCTENIARALVVGSDGGVSPCVMAQIPVKGSSYCYFRGKRRILEKLTFGNIGHESLNTIWHRKEYRQFVRTFLRGQVPSFCQNCLKRYIDDMA